jgi:hypothetical protein
MLEGRTERDLRSKFTVVIKLGHILNILLLILYSAEAIYIYICVCVCVCEIELGYNIKK